jgi:hypothetical protein
MPSLPLTGVPDQLQPQPPAPQSAPAIPAPAPGMPVDGQIQVNLPQYDQAAAQQAAVQRDQSLQAQAQQIYPQDNTASLLATLAGVAGNIAGAMNNHGAAGETSLQYGDQLRERAVADQQKFVARTREEEAKYKTEQEQKFALQNKQLRANSLVPLVNSVSDPKMKAVLFTQLAAGDVDGAEANFRHFQEMKRQEVNDLLNRQIKLQSMENQQLRIGMAQQENEMKQKLQEITLAQKQQDFVLKPAREQQKIMAQETRDYNNQLGKIKGPISDYVDIVQQLGGLDSPDAQKKLTRILGLGGTIKGTITGSAEDKALYQKLNRIFGGTLRAEDFGSRFSAAEQKIVSDAAGFTVGGGAFANTFRNPDSVIQGLKVIENEFRTKLNSAAAGKQDRTLQEFEKGGSPITPHAFDTALANAALTGPVDMNKVPAGVDPSVWVQMNQATRAQFHKHLRGQ